MPCRSKAWAPCRPRAYRATPFVVFGRLFREVAAGAIIRSGAVAVIHGGRAGARRQHCRSGDRRRRLWAWAVRGHPQRRCVPAHVATSRFPAARDLWLHELAARQADTCEPEMGRRGASLFILYTSGSTASQRCAAQLRRLPALGDAHDALDVRHQAVGTFFWCTADIGWVTGHTYIAYGPLAVGATEIIFEGSDLSRRGPFWQTIAKHKVSVLLHGPTAIRPLVQSLPA